MRKRSYLLAIFLLVISLCLLRFRGLHNNYKVEVAKSIALIEQRVDDEKKIIDELKHTYNNDEIVGILEIENTDLKVPIVQSQDNKKYLTKDILGNKNRSGTPFLDYRVDINDSNKLLIYGHNSSNKEVPFTRLENYYDKDYFDNHRYITLKTDEKIVKYEIFSVYVETGDWSYMKVKFENEEEWFEHLKMLKNKSLYGTGVDIDKSDQILILQTCSRKQEYKKYKYKYLLIISRRVN